MVRRHSRGACSGREALLEGRDWLVGPIGRAGSGRETLLKGL